MPKNSIFAQMTAAGFAFRGDFSGKISVKLKWTGEWGIIGVLIDDDIDTMLTVNIDRDGEHELCSLRGIHTVQIIKLNEYSRNTIEFISLSFEGELCAAPEPKPLFFEFYGDSLSCGYGNLCVNRDKPNPFCPQENGYLTWCSFISRRLGADFAVAASSGQGIVTDCTGNPQGVVAKYWDVAVKQPLIKWDFSRKADFVFIYLGANDMNYARFNEAKIDEQAFERNARTLIDGIRSHYPDCKILLLFGHDDGNEFFDVITGIYRKLCGEYNDMYLFDNLQSNQLGGDWHPSVADHRMIYSQLLEHMLENFDFE